jgi:hypothetical protein
MVPEPSWTPMLIHALLVTKPTLFMIPVILFLSRASLICWALSRRFLLLLQQLPMMTPTLTLHTFYSFFNHFLSTSWTSTCCAHLKCNAIKSLSTMYHYYIFHSTNAPTRTIQLCPHHHTTHCTSPYILAGQLHTLKQGSQRTMRLQVSLTASMFT